MEFPTPRPDAAERTERHLSLLAELADGAAELARDAMRTALRRSAAAAAAEAAGLPPPPCPARPDGPDPTEAFCRMSREVCRLVVLEAKVAGQWKAAERDRRRERRIAPRRTRLRQILHEAVILHAEPDDEDADEAARQTIEEALDAPAIERLMADGAPLGDVVAAICSRFGVMVDPDLLPPDASQATTGLPFSGRPPLRAPAFAGRGPDPP